MVRICTFSMPLESTFATIQRRISVGPFLFGAMATTHPAGSSQSTLRGGPRDVSISTLVHLADCLLPL